jgi:elongin-A
MPAPSLVDMCRRRATKDVNLIYDIADMPYSLVESILRHVQNPAQLQELEENSPQIQGETAGLWLKFIKRDIPNWDKKPHEPRDPRNWSKVYRKLKKESEREKQEQGEALKQQLRAIQQDRAQNKTVIVDSKVGYGSRSSRIFMGGSSSAWGGSSGAPSKTGKVAMDKLKRGVFDHNRARPKSIQIPTHILAARKPRLIAAPARMVRMAEYEANANSSLSRSVAPPVARRIDSTPAMKQPHITHRPVPQQSAAPPRTSPPADQSLTAPKPSVPDTGVSPAPKRKRQESSLFHKRRKI